jgi:hypothetical protein
VLPEADEPPPLLPLEPEPDAELLLPLTQKPNRQPDEPLPLLPLPLLLREVEDPLPEELDEGDDPEPDKDERTKETETEMGGERGGRTLVLQLDPSTKLTRTRLPHGKIQTSRPQESVQVHLRKRTGRPGRTGRTGRTG